MNFIDGDPYHLLVLHIYLSRVRRLSFHDFLDACVHSPITVFDEFVRFVSERYTISPIAPRSWRSVNCSLINRYLLDRKIPDSGTLKIPATHFTTMEMHEIEVYVKAFAARPEVAKLVHLRNVSEQPIQISRKIDELGGEFMETVCVSEPSKELHRFVCSYMFDVQRQNGNGCTHCIIISIHDACAQIVKIAPTVLPASYFQCVAVDVEGKMCGKQAAVKCLRCHRAFFCSKRCQKSDASVHVSECDVRCKRKKASTSTLSVPLLLP